MIGPYRRHSHLSTWKLLECPDARRSQIFFETSSRSVLRFALESSNVDPNDNPPYGPPPASVPESQPMEDYFHTWCILNSVTSIRRCYGLQGGDQVILGLLLLNEDGTESCVGQIRRDCLGCSEKIDVSGRLWLGFSLNNDEPRVVRAETSHYTGRQNRDAGGLSWFVVPWEGQLEWWFSFRQTKVCHEGRASPETRIDFGGQ